MFGFLKKKLQDAISKFSKDAKESVVEQKVEEESAIAQAKQEEERLLSMQERKVEEIPELPKEKAQHEAEEHAKPAAEAAKKPADQRPLEKAKTSEPKAPERVIEKKPEPKSEPKKEPAKIEKPVEKPKPAEKIAPKVEQKPADHKIVREIPGPKAKPQQAEAKVQEKADKAQEKAEPERVERPAHKPLAKQEKPAHKVPEPAKLQAQGQKTPPTPAIAPVRKPEEEKQATQQKTGFFKSLFGKKPKEAEQPKQAQPEPARPEPVKPQLPPAKPAEPAQKPAAPAPKKTAEPKSAPAAPAPQVTVVEPPAAPIAASAPAASAAPSVTVPPEAEEKRGFFARLGEAFTKKTLSEEKFEEIFWELEVALLENNVAVEVIEKIKNDLKRALTAGKVSRLGVEELVLLSLKQSVEEVLSVPAFDLVERIKSSGKRPYVICFIGVNGSGKTTTLAKIANMLQNEELSVVMAASDTFRAAAIDQLKEHADKLGIKLISQGYGADPAAVAFDAIEHAKARNIDVVMIDTAGRLHSNTNLMAELQKVVRVAKPDLKIFIGESITGNDCVEQAKEFDRIAGIDAIILSKADVDEKGGAALSVSYVTKKPILYLGVGQAYGDLKRFDKEEIVGNLGL